MFNYDPDAIAANRRKDVVSLANQAMDELAVEAALEGKNLEDLGFAEIRELIFLIDQRASKTLDENHNVQAETPVATLSARAVADVRTALTGKSIYELSMEEILQWIWIIDQKAAAETQADHTIT